LRTKRDVQSSTTLLGKGRPIYCLMVHRRAVLRDQINLFRDANPRKGPVRGFARPQDRQGLGPWTRKELRYAIVSSRPGGRPLLGGTFPPKSSGTDSLMPLSRLATLIDYLTGAWGVKTAPARGPTPEAYWPKGTADVSRWEA